MSGQRGLLNRPNGWSKQTPPRRQDPSYLTHIMSTSALAQQLRLQDQPRKGQMRSQLARESGTQSIPVFLSLARTGLQLIRPVLIKNGVSGARTSTVIGQFFRFGAVGTSGFLIDTAIVYGLRGRLGLYGAGMVSYLVAASWAWALNRGWTFRGRGSG